MRATERSRPASASACCWPAPSSTTRRSWCSTSRPPGSTSPAASSSWRCSRRVAVADTGSVVLVTHHVDEIPPGFTHVLMLGGGRVVARGPLEATLTAERLSTCFGLPLRLARRDGRWWGGERGTPRAEDGDAVSGHSRDDGRVLPELAHERIHHRAERAGLRVDAALPAVARPHPEHLLDPRQLAGARQPLRRRGQRLDQPQNAVRQPLEPTLLIDDDVRVDGPAGRRATCSRARSSGAARGGTSRRRTDPPATRSAPGRAPSWRSRRSASAEAVADPDLDGAEVRVGADVPPDLADRLDRAGVDQRNHQPLELGPVPEAVRQPGRRQALEDLDAARGQAGVGVAEERRARRQRQEMRQVRGQRVEDRDRLLPASPPRRGRAARRSSGASPATGSGRPACGSGPSP